MNNESIYLAWAPPASIWSQWAKPVLFAHINTLTPQPQNPDPVDINISQLPRADGSTAMVVDLPGAQSSELGLKLTTLGYRPMPLFNSVPSGLDPVIAMGEVVSSIVHGAPPLQSVNLPSEAPPAFLLDSRRRGMDVIIHSRMFDNRSISLPTDFPSANLLLHHGIKRIIVVQEQSRQPQQDVSHTLRRWQQAGIGIFSYTLLIPGAPMPIVVQRPPWFRHFWYGLLARFGLRRHPLGGFGGFIPEPSSAG